MYMCVYVDVCIMCMDVGMHVCISFIQQHNISQQVASPAIILYHNAAPLSLIRKKACMLISDNAVLTPFTYSYYECGWHGNTLTNDVYQHLSK